MEKMNMLILYLSYIDNEEDKQLFEQVYNDYRKQMITQAIVFLQDKTEAEDVVHDVFLHIATSKMDILYKIRDKSDMRDYLLKATKNTALNRIRKKNRQNISIDTVEEYNLKKETCYSDEEFINEICNRYKYEQVKKAIENLAPKYRDALYYHFIVELSIKEVAKTTEQSVFATKKQLVRGKKMLISLLKEKGDDKNGN